MADQDPALAEQRAAQRAARLAQLRRMSSLEYVGKTALDATVAAVFLTPPFFIVNTLSSFLGQKANTFGQLITTGMKASAGTTARQFAWVVGASSLAAVGKELTGMGPRHQSPEEQEAARGKLMGLYALTGMATAHAVTGGVASRTLLVALGGVGGAFLPAGLAVAGPAGKAWVRGLLGGGRSDE